MRFLGTVISAAILLFLLYLFVGWMVDGYFGGNMVPNDAVPGSWAAPDSWSEWRDIVIVVTSTGSTSTRALRNWPSSWVPS